MGQLAPEADPGLEGIKPQTSRLYETAARMAQAFGRRFSLSPVGPQPPAGKIVVDKAGRKGIS